MTGEERYRVIELATTGKMPMKEICQSFGVSRQTLNQAMEKTKQASMTALSPKKPGRKGKSEEQQKIMTLSKQISSLKNDVEHWKTRYDVAHAYIEITRDAVQSYEWNERQTERNRRKRERQRNKKKRHKSAHTIPGTTADAGKPAKLGDISDSGCIGDTVKQFDSMENEE
jgi:transposase-like protein